MRIALTLVPLALLGALTAVSACASSSANHPSATQHDALAAQDEAAAKTHLTSFDPKHPPREGNCGGSLSPTGGFETCWTANDAAHEAAAREHLRDAAQHRAASQALRDAEARACTGISDIDRDVSPFAHRKDILAVHEISDQPAPHSTPRLMGASVVFRPVPGLTAEKLQRIVDCHVAKNDAMGHTVPEESFCPLVPPNVTAKVTAVAEGMRVDIRTDDADAAREVLRRARTLAEP